MPRSCTDFVPTPGLYEMSEWARPLELPTLHGVVGLDCAIELIDAVRRER